MISGYGQDADITAILDTTEFHIVLQSNPDGRHLVETDRTTMRRKNLNSGSTNCRPYNQGVDLNRNFPFRWGLRSGSSPKECSWTFRGKRPASEPEVSAIQNYTESIFPVSQRKARPYAQEKLPYSESKTMGLFVDIHSFGNMILSPW
jgi:carboxypeptidase T